MRINKYLAACSVASRRESDKIIEQGRVKVNGRVVKTLGLDVDEVNDVVHVDGKVVRLMTDFVYLMLHKPKGYISTVADDKGRKTVIDLIKGYEAYRIFPIGRLDYDSEGLLLLTNDGDLAYKLTHPSSEITKTYNVKIDGIVTRDELVKISDGVVIDGKKTMPCKAQLLGVTGNISRIEIVIREGRNRQVRKMFEEGIGKEVVFLKRVKIGELKLGSLNRGSFRQLTVKELRYLQGL